MDTADFPRAITCINAHTDLINCAAFSSAVTRANLVSLISHCLTSPAEIILKIKCKQAFCTFTKIVNNARKV